MTQVTQGWRSLREESDDAGWSVRKGNGNGTAGDEFTVRARYPGMRLVDGRAYRLMVRAAGNATAGVVESSDQTLVDGTPPELSAVTAGPCASSPGGDPEDVVLAPSPPDKEKDNGGGGGCAGGEGEGAGGGSVVRSANVTVEACWSAFPEPHSRVVAYEVRLTRRRGAAETAEEEEMGAVRCAVDERCESGGWTVAGRTVAVTGLDLHNGDVLRFAVRAENAAGLRSAEARSGPITAVLAVKGDSIMLGAAIACAVIGFVFLAAVAVRFCSPTVRTEAEQRRAELQRLNTTRRRAADEISTVMDQLATPELAASRSSTPRGDELLVGLRNRL